LAEKRANMLWLFITILIMALIAIYSAHGNEKRKRNRELERIQRRLAEKESEKTSASDVWNCRFRVTARSRGNLRCFQLLKAN
jgi:hypothetical protein